MDLAEIPPATYKRLEMRRYEAQFMLPTGAVDLLAMSFALRPEVFREYIGLSREYRRLHRLELNQTECSPGTQSNPTPHLKAA